MPSYPYIFYAEPSMLGHLPPSRMIWIPAKLQNQEQLFHHLRRQLPTSVTKTLETSWDSLEACLDTLSLPTQPLTFFIHENIPALPKEDQISYMRSLSKFSMSAHDQRSNLTAMFPLEDMRVIEKLHNEATKQEDVHAQDYDDTEEDVAA